MICETRRRLILAALLAPLALGGCAVKTSLDDFTNAELARDLVRHTFDATEDGYGWMGGTAPKWTTPARVLVAGEEAGRYRALVEADIARLARLTGLDHRVVRAVEGCDFDAAPGENFLVLLMRHAYAPDACNRSGLLFLNPNLRELAPYVRGTLAFQTNTKPGGLAGFVRSRSEYSGREKTLVRAVSVIDVAAPKTVSTEKTIHEEILQAFALFRDVYGAEYSMVGVPYRYGDLTAKDELLVRVYYDPRIPLGLSARELYVKARHVLNDLRPGK